MEMTEREAVRSRLADRVTYERLRYHRLRGECHGGLVPFSALETARRDLDEAERALFVFDHGGEL